LDRYDGLDKATPVLLLPTKKARQKEMRGVESRLEE